MREQQQAAQATQAAPLAPATPATPTPPSARIAQTAPVIPGPSTPLDLSRFTLPQLKSMLQELRNQRADYASRRQTTGESYEAATGASREGMGERLRVLDNNIMAYENEMVRVGREIAARGGNPVTTEPSGTDYSGWMREDDAAGMAFGFSFATLLLTIFITRRFMRRKYAGIPAGRNQQPNLIASNERLERIEQAVDTIAVEIERVSENQRFMTRLMTETQLGETLKDVRKSTELAKSAAESSG
jgi:hypothetical protein